MWHQKLKEWIAHPLFLLLVGALISSYLIPSWTRRWQDHQKELELKVALIREINDSIMNMIMRIEVVEILAITKQDKEKEYEDMQSYYKKWIVEKEVIGSNIQAFFPDNIQIGRKWTDLTTIVYLLEALSEVGNGEKNETRKNKLRQIQKLIPKERSSVDLEELSQRNIDNWLELKRLTVSLKNELVNAISKSRVSSF